MTRLTWALLLLLPLLASCSGRVEQLEEQAHELEQENWKLEQQLAEIARRMPQLRERVERVFAYARQNSLDLNALSSADERIATILANPNARNRELLEEIDKIREEANDLDFRIRSAYGHSTEIAHRAGEVANLATQVRSEQDIARNLANLLGSPLGLKLGGDVQTPSQPVDDGSGGGSNAPLGWLLGMGTAATAGAGMWAYKRYRGRGSQPDREPAVPGSNINVSVGTPAPSMQSMHHPAPISMGGYVSMPNAPPGMLPAQYSGAGPGGAGHQQPFHDAPMNSGPSDEEIAAAAAAAQKVTSGRQLSPDAIRSGEHAISAPAGTGVYRRSYMPGNRQT